MLDFHNFLKGLDIEANENRACCILICDDT